MPYPNECPMTLPQEDQTMHGAFDDRTYTEGFVDLRKYEDDKTVLRNPHKGWFWHYIDNGMRHGAYRDRNETDYSLAKDFPALNHLYLRFDWSDIEKEPGVYDFSPLEDIMERWEKAGMTFSLRVCTYESAPDMDATPRYIFKRSARCIDIPGSALQPDYGDPIFLERLEAFLEALGKRYDGDPRIEIVDIGTYGTWGEGHTVTGDGVIYPVDVVLKHFALHEKYFPDTFLLCNDDHIIGRMAHGDDEMNRLLRYCEARGYGVQDDSICCDGYTQSCGYDTMRARWAFERLGSNAPNAIELAHYTYIKPVYESHFRGGFTIIEALKNSRATFAGFHGYPRDWLAGEPYLTEYCANRLGYWLFVPSAVLPPLQNTSHNIIKVRIENHGWAHPYWKTDVKIRLTGANGEKTIAAEGIDLRKLNPDCGEDYEIPLDLRGLPSGNYMLSLGVSDAKTGRNIKLALKEELFKNGFYNLGYVSVGEAYLCLHF
jgi:hypothetical protein